MIIKTNKKIKYIKELICDYKNWYAIVLTSFFGLNIRILHLRNGVTIVGGYKSLILDLVDEIFIKKVYNPDFLRIKKDDIVVDIGANIGVFSLFAAKQNAKKIFSLEPVAQNINAIRKNFEINKMPQPKTIKAAVSDSVGIGKLYLGDLDSHGLLFDHNNGGKLSRCINVNMITLKHFLKIHKIKQVDFLKIDCEGSEGAIIRSTPVEIWSKINKIAIEYHDNVSILSHKEIVKELKGFGYTTKTKISDPLFGYIYAWRNSKNK